MKRRRLLTSAAAAGTAVGLAAASHMTTDGRSSETAPSAVEAGGPVMAYVSDAANGKVVVMVGSKEIERTDRGLVADMTAIAREADDVLPS